MRSLVLALPLLLVSAAPQDDFDARVEAFAARISTADDPLAARFQKAAATRPGKVVLRDRTEKAADAQRGRSERDAVPEYFRTFFEETGDVYRLRKGQEEYRRRLIEEFAGSKADLERIRPIVKEVADNLADSPEINARLKKFLSHPSVVEHLYLKDVRPKSRPDVYVLLKKLGEVFAQGEDGRFYIPEARHELADKFVKIGRAVLETTKSISDQLGSACSTLVELDDLHKRAKAAAADPLFAMVVVKKALDGADLNDLEPSIQRLREMADELGRKLPDLLETTPKGKVLTEKAADGVGKALETYDRARAKVGLLREPGRQLAGRLRDGDERTETFRAMLRSDAILFLLDVDTGGDEADPAKYVEAKIKRAVAKDADGKYRVLPEVAEELGREIKDPARMAEKEDRAFKIVSMFGEKLEDKDLREIFTSRYGTFEVARTMKERLAARSFDGLGGWIERHFEASGPTLKLRAGSKGEIETLLAEVDRLEKESKKNDLKD